MTPPVFSGWWFGFLSSVRCLFGRLNVWMELAKFLTGATRETFVIMVRYFFLSFQDHNVQKQRGDRKGEFLRAASVMDEANDSLHIGSVASEF